MIKGDGSVADARSWADSGVEGGRVTLVLHTHIERDTGSSQNHARSQYQDPDDWHHHKQFPFTHILLLLLFFPRALRASFGRREMAPTLRQVDSFGWTLKGDCPAPAG